MSMIQEDVEFLKVGSTWYCRSEIRGVMGIGRTKKEASEEYSRLLRKAGRAETIVLNNMIHQMKKNNYVLWSDDE